MITLNVSVAAIAALVGNPARTNIVAALMDGRALTSKELAYLSGVTPQTASGHLMKLAEANLVTLRKQGRHHYYQLASPLVGQMLESIMAVAGRHVPPNQRLRSRIDEEMRTARTCYDHIAGRLGVAMADALGAQGCIILGDDGGELTGKGEGFMAAFGADMPDRRRSQRAYCRPCLDWSERRFHIAGAVGASLCSRCLELGWVKRRRDTRALEITERGRVGFEELLGIDVCQAVKTAGETIVGSVPAV